MTEKKFDPTLHSINEPGPDAPKPYRVPDELAYPAAEASKPATKAKGHEVDPDDLEDEMNEEGYSTKSHGKPKRK